MVLKSMNKKKAQELDMPPTWEEMRAGEIPVELSSGWTREELSKAWIKSEKCVMRALKEQGWVCVGRRGGVGMCGQKIATPLYAPKA
jgi:hypothetical protein